MLETWGLSKSYGRTQALVDLNLQVRPGEILGFLGPNGAGKSTTVRILAGLIPADRGRASIAGFDIAADPIEAKRRTGYVPETPKLYESLTADAFLDIIGALHHLDPETSRQRRGELLEIFDLASSRHTRLREFSKGMRQKVVIIAALLHRPDVLILDEPFDGIDANTTLVLKSLIVQLANQGKAILFSSHVLEVVERICTRVCVIHHGRKLVEGTADEIRAAYRAPTLDEAFARLTGIREPSAISADILAALERT